MHALRVATFVVLLLACSISRQMKALRLVTF
jgi:hypothetical protein